MTTERADVLVIGAGLAGVAVAYHLAARHVGPIVAFEASTPAAGATGRAAGIVSEQLWDRWDVEVVRESREEYADLARRVVPGAYRVNGFVRWTAHEGIAAALRARSAELRSWGVDARDVDGGAVGDLVPGLRADDLRAGSYAPGDAVIAPSTLAEAYGAEGRALGVGWRLASPISRLEGGPRAWSVTVRGVTYNAPAVVVAAGAWTKRLLAASGLPLPLAPYRTQAAVLRRPEGFPASLPSFHDLDTDVYGRPEENGRLLAGDGTERHETDPETYVPTGDDAFVAHLAECFEHRFPGWSETTVVRAWAGVCTATPDRRPLVGPVPSAEGLYVITGFNGFGVMRAAGAARRLADVVAAGGTEAGPRLAPVDPGRFSGPAVPFAPKPGFTLQGGPDAPF